MSKGNSLKRKETRTGKKLGTFLKKGKKHGKQKYWLSRIDFPSPLEFSEVCFRVEAKIITLSDVILNVGRGNV